MKKILNYSFILIPLLFSCGGHQEERGSAYEEIKKAGWLIGSWGGSSPEGAFSEHWEQLNDSIFTGKGFFIAGKDTVSAESLRLVEEGGKLFYEPTVSNQNEGKAVRFEMTQISDKALVFENPSHDFPQKISYRRISEDSVVASISGMLQGKESEQVFPMKRMN